MMVFAQLAGLLLVAAIAADEVPSPPPLRAPIDPNQETPATTRPQAREAAAPAKKGRKYVVQVKLIEIDDQGRETVLAEPRLQTAGGNAGISVDQPDGRRFDFSVRLTDRLSGDELMPVRTQSSESTARKLQQHIDLDIQRQPRREVLREVSRRSGISIAVDPESVKTIAAEMDAAVDLKVKDESVAVILDRLVESLKLDYVVKHDVVLIATAERLVPSSDDLILKTYVVADLVAPADGEVRTPDFAPLIERIKSTVLPASWERKEAAATIRPFDSTLSIVVRHTATGHAAIERLLERIRREPPKAISE